MLNRAAVLAGNTILKGCTLRDLELDYEAGESFPRAFIKSIRARRTFSVFSIASLATAVVLIDGPLLQPASSVSQATTAPTVMLNVSLAPQLPSGFSGRFGNLNDVLSSDAVAVGHAYIHSEPMNSTTECNGTCFTTVRGPAFVSASCTNKTWQIT